MQHVDYVPLHVHSEYSLLDGAIKLGELVEAAARYRMPAVAVTDHGNMFGAVDFYFKAVKAGVKPILGCEVYVADDHTARDDSKPFHLILLARDNKGYVNLITLISKAYLDGFHKRPRMDRRLLEEHAEGLLGLSACLQGEVPYYLRQGDLKKAREVALEYRRILGDENFYLEVQKNGLKEQDEVNAHLAALSAETGIPLVATNDCHYLREEDAKAHEVLLCIQTGRTMNDPGRFRFNGRGYYFRSPEEMKAEFAEFPGAVEITRTIAERCNVDFRTGEPLLPRIKTDEGIRPRDLLDKWARKGLASRMGENPPAGYLERFEMEMSVITKMGYSSYFLIVSDFINYAREHDIPVGPGRGSAAGSLVAYCLGITDIDPIRYGLLFERFLNPERVSLPDIDVDFCRDKRAEVIRYVSDKYGKDHVSQIITFGTMAAKAAIRDVARAMDFPYAEADRLAKLVPDTLKITIKQAMKDEPQLQKEYDENDGVRELLDIAMRLEGMARHASTHAAGVVIAPEPLTNFAPLYKAPNDDAITTQFDMGSVERIGLIKFDFLGLKTLTIIEKCVESIRASGQEMDIRNVPLDDAETYRFLGTGQTTGVFQLESDGMKDILIKMKPNRFEDIIALVALYRPGPIGSGMIDTFIKRKKGQESIEYEMPELKDILDETYGVILYQEQVMSIANRLASFSLGQADVLRKAMGKKKADVMAEQKDLFIKGATANRFPEKKAERIFDLMSKFAEYGFNKSHSAAYAYISYQTAYLKAHYAVHFMAATLSADLDNSDKIVKSIKECREMSVAILPPDINRCGREFTVDGDAIRFGLGAVKGVGTAAVDAIIEARQAAGPFDSLEDYLARVDTRKINKKVNESLIKSGAFDSTGEPVADNAALGAKRAALMARLQDAGGSIPSLSLFGPEEGQEDNQPGHAWDEAELLKHEKDSLGFYISGNPLRKYSPMLKVLGIRTVSALADMNDGDEVTAAGIVMAVRKIRTKKGELMAALSMEDESGSAEAIVFPDLYREHAGLFVKDTPILFGGKLEKSDKGLKVVATEAKNLKDAMGEDALAGRRAYVSVANGAASGDGLRRLRELAEQHGGRLPLFIRIESGGTETIIETSMSVSPDMGLLDAVEEVCGKGSLKVV